MFSSAASAPAYTMLRSSVRLRSPWKFSTHIFAERDAEYRDAFAHELRLEGPRRVVQQVAARPHRGDVLRVCGWIQRNDEIHLVRPRGVAVLADANLVDTSAVPECSTERYSSR